MFMKKKKQATKMSSDSHSEMLTLLLSLIIQYGWGDTI